MLSWHHILVMRECHMCSIYLWGPPGALGASSPARELMIQCPASFTRVEMVLTYARRHWHAGIVTVSCNLHLKFLLFI